LKAAHPIHDGLQAEASVFRRTAARPPPVTGRSLPEPEQPSGEAAAML